MKGRHRTASMPATGMDAAQLRELGELESRIQAHGYAVRWVEWCEDARTPGLLGQIRAVVDRERREVKLGKAANPTPELRLDILRHELRHLDEPEWDCGNRDVFGRGGPPEPPCGS